MASTGHHLWLHRLRDAGLELSRGFLHLLYPGTCAVCGQALPLEQSNLCAACRTCLTTDPLPTCPRCAGSVGPYVPLADGCVDCRDESFSFERVLRLGPYDGLLRDVILRMKHQTGDVLAEILAEVWADQAGPHLKEARPDVVLPVPLHWWRRLRRGYNQSETLARGLAARLGLPCRPRWLRRVRNTSHQTGLSRTARHENVRDAFRASRWAGVRNKTVLLVDDVLTTGTTANEAARALRAAGAARVLVAVLARSQG